MTDRRPIEPRRGPSAALVGYADSAGAAALSVAAQPGQGVGNDAPDPALPAARLRWIKSATLVQLHNEHAAANRDLNLPGSELWAEAHAECEADLAALWAEIQSRAARAPVPQMRKREAACG